MRSPARRRWRESPWSAAALVAISSAVLLPQFLGRGDRATDLVDPSWNSPSEFESTGAMASGEVFLAAVHGFDPVRGDERIDDPFAAEPTPVDSRPADLPAAPGGAGSIAELGTLPVVSLVLRLRGARVAVVDGVVVRPGDRLTIGTVEEVVSVGVRIRRPSGAPLLLPLGAPVRVTAAPNSGSDQRETVAEPAAIDLRGQVRRTLEDLEATLGGPNSPRRP